MKTKSIVTEIKKKMKKVTSIICATAMLIGSLSAMPSVTSKAADTDFQMRAGASIRLNAGSTGIRFAVEIGDTVKNILFTESENLTFKSNVEVGMLVVPKGVLDSVSDGADYFETIEANYRKTKGQIATTFSEDQFKKENGKLVATAAIVNIKDTNFAREYQAVAFYSTDGGATYTYTAKSNARTIGYVADSVLKNDVQKDYTSTNAEIAGQLLAQYIKANRNYDLSLNMNSGDSVDLSDTYVKGLEGTSASQYTYTVQSGNDTVNLSGSTLTAKQAGTATVLMQAYGNLIKLELQVTVAWPALELEYRYGTNKLIQVNTNLPSNTPLANFTAGENGCNIDQSVNKYQQFGWAGMDNANGTIVLTLHFNNAFEAGQTYILKSGSVFGFTDGNSYTLDKDYVFTWDGSTWTVSNEIPAEPVALELGYRYGTDSLIQVNTNLPTDTPCVNFAAGENGCNIDQSVNKYQQFGWAGMDNANGTIVLTLHFNNAFEAGQTYILKSGSVFGFTDGKTYTLDKDYVFTWDGSTWTVSNEIPAEPVALELGYRYGEKNLIQVNTNLPSTTPCVNFTAEQNGCNIDQSANEYQQIGWAGMDNANGTIVLTLHFNNAFEAGQTYILKSGSVFGFTDGNTYKLDKDYVFTWDGSNWTVSNKLPTDVDENARFLTFADIPVDGTDIAKIEQFKALGFTTALVTEDHTGACLAIYDATVTKGGDTVTLKTGQQELELTYTGYMGDRTSCQTGKMMQIKTNLPTDGKYSNFLLSDASSKGYTVTVENDRNIGWFQLWNDPDSKAVYLNPQFSDYFKDGEQFILKAGTTFTVNGTDYVLCKDFIATIKNPYLASIQNLYDAGLNVWIRNYANKPGYFTGDFIKVLKKYENEISGFYIADEAFDTEALLTTAGQNDITTSFDAIQTEEIPWFKANFPNAYFHTNQVPLSSYDHYGDASKPANADAYARAYSTFLQNYTTKILNNLKNAGKTICYDNYPFVKKGMGGIFDFIEQDTLSEDYLFNMLLAAKAAKEAPEGTNFGICVQTFSSDYNRDIESAEDVTFQLYNGIAMGADMFEYFAYNSNSGVDGIMKDDTPRIYNYVKAANDEVFPYATVIKSYDWQGIQLSNGTTHDNATAFTKITDASATLGGVVMTDATNGVLGNVTSTRDAVIGCFKKNGKDGYMVVNYNDPTQKKYDNVVSLTFSGYSTVTVYTSTGSEMQKETVTLDNGVYTTTIKPGKAFFVIPNA